MSQSTIVGLEKLYYAKLTSDERGGLIAYDAPIYLDNVKEISINPKQNTEKGYGGNKLVLQMTTLDEIEVGINLLTLTNAQKADLLGHKLAAEGGVISKSDDIAPYVALLYLANKSNGEKRYGILYKGKMQLPEGGAKGQEGKAEIQSNEMKAIFQPLSDGTWQYQVDTDDPNCPATIDTTFFTDVLIPTEASEGTVV
ncbi:phage tail protein [Clostridium sp. D2Q-11]|uniref:Phage tail protein n=1 Tax=Anaeromonas frigoriresistens TaxID=2683708 RepID=A0A942ZAJ3_9FIRM|nr:major tail protein [Anaeromonas frigoriresistens]MBS4539825.1 phage tail protein [Anaeromonas frigoriresistens]